MCLLHFFNGKYILSEPWTIALSKSANRKYFYNIKTRMSTFEAPPDSVASAR